ncbi:hypothetical protein AAG570_011256 [Ranatra chinensis]|uniref:MYND-type domain-containing protein n=1 Tax=Ranatra chinensis TaxID=642074 RepID=A0ABD0YK39_9HEMI
MLKKGTLLHEEKPFAHVLSSNFRFTRCDNCYSKTELLKCSGCQYVRYCDRGCQKVGWTDHKSECPLLRKLPHGRNIPNSARLIAKIIMKLKRGGDREMGLYAKNKYRVFRDLMSHYSDIKEDLKKQEHIISLYEVLKEYLGEESLPNSAEFLGLYGRVVVNSFNILDVEMASIGTGIYLGASTIDHSCEPNAVATFTGTKIHIRALQDFLIYDWSKIRISYIDLLKTSKERIEDLMAQYYFLCDCARCLNVDEERLMNSMLCQNPLCKQPVPVDQVEMYFSVGNSYDL